MEALNVKAVSRLSGVSEFTLRAWEKRYQAVTPKRTASGRRIYTLADVERLRLLLALVNLGHSIGNIARLPNEELLRLKDHSLRPDSLSASALPATEEAKSEEQEQALSRCMVLLKKLLDDYQTTELSRELAHARGNFSARTFLLKVVVPVFGWVGEQVAAKKLSIAQEHLLSAILRDRLAEVYLTLDPRSQDARAKCFLFTTPEGDLHEFGILIGSILCTLWRQKPDFLGPSMPAEEVARAARELRSDVVVLGSLELPKGTLKISLEQYLKKLDALLPSRVAVWVGGSAVKSLKKLQLSRPLERIESMDQLELCLRDCLG